MTRADVAHGVERALVARGAVRRGRHLRFACPSHDDRRPSADFEPERAVWVCRSATRAAADPHVDSGSTGRPAAPADPANPVPASGIARRLGVGVDGDPRDGPSPDQRLDPCGTCSGGTDWPRYQLAPMPGVWPGLGPRMPRPDPLRPPSPSDPDDHRRGGAGRVMRDVAIPWPTRSDGHFAER
jgi:hypothetical protein